MRYEICDPLPTRLGLLVVIGEAEPTPCKYRSFGKVADTPAAAKLWDKDPDVPTKKLAKKPKPPIPNAPPIADTDDEHMASGHVIWPWPQHRPCYQGVYFCSTSPEETKGRIFRRYWDTHNWSTMFEKDMPPLAKDGRLHPDNVDHRSVLWWTQESVE